VTPVLKGWQGVLKANAIPWLLEGDNPSARYLTLRYLLDSGEWDSQVVETRAGLPAWPPVREILDMMDPADLWGRADRPFYGGAMGTHATLSLLAELGLARIPPLEAACENLLKYGQHKSGGFTYDAGFLASLGMTEDDRYNRGTPGRILLCYTGTAICTLIAFGYLEDPRLARALEYLVGRSLAPDGLACPYADGQECQWGIAKGLAAFAALPAADRTAERMEAVERLANAVLDHGFDFEGRDARWLDFGFPLNYQSDLVELSDALARLGYGPDPRTRRLLDLVLAAQTDDGRWIKRYGTRVFQVEEQGQPSKWITMRALRALKHAHQDQVRVEQTRMRSKEVWFAGTAGS
jgi:hypothetical protein